jgi:hypothetical protein
MILLTMLWLAIGVVVAFGLGRVLWLRERDR